jgi:hypothetical protein
MMTCFRLADALAAVASELELGLDELGGYAFELDVDGSRDELAGLRSLRLDCVGDDLGEREQSSYGWPMRLTNSSRVAIPDGRL